MWSSAVRVIITLALGILMVPLAANAEQAGKLVRIGWLSLFSPPDPARPPYRLSHTLFPQVIAELGWVEGQNMIIDFRFAEMRYDRLPELAAELVRLKPDVIIGHTTLATLALKQATTTIPIVMIFVGDAINEGLVPSLARPGGNVTGVSSLLAEVVPKRLELLREAVPKLSRLAVIFNPNYPGNVPSVRETSVAAQALGSTLQLLEVRDRSEFEDAFTAMTRERPDALFVLIDPLIASQGRQIADLAVRHQLPTMCEERTQAVTGCLMTYGVNPRDVVRRGVYYVDRILKGATPADLPVEQPTKFELVINLKTAKALSLTIPPTLLFQADEVIQ